MVEQHQLDFRKMLRWFVKEEVKTPLAFFFKVIPYMTAAWIAILYSPVPNDTKFALIKFSAEIFGGFVILVAVFAFLKPRNLVYGESGHRAERKIELGTETRAYTSDELSELTQTKNPQQLPNGGEEPQ
jgi:hypothetical protein